LVPVRWLPDLRRRERPGAMTTTWGQDVLLRRSGARYAAAGSLLKTGSGIFLVVLLPPLLSRTLGSIHFAAWALCAELAGYLVLLETGMGNAVSSSVAPLGSADAAAATRGLMPLSLLFASIAVGVAAIIALLLPFILKNAPAALVAESQRTFLLLAAPSIAVVSTGAISGFYASRQANFVPGLGLFLGRALACTAVAALALQGAGMLELAAVWAGLASLPLLLLAVQFGLRWRVPAAATTRVRRRVVASSCGSYSAWALAGFLIVGLDTSIVARHELPFVGVYAVAASVLLVLQAGVSAALAPLFPRVAQAISANRAPEAVQELSLLVRLCGIGLGMAIAIVLAAPNMVIGLLSANASARAGTILTLLLLAGAIRLPMLPLSTALIAALEHRRLIWLPLVEAGVNVSLSLALAPHYGAVGVAFGTLAGSIVGVLTVAFWAAPRLRRLPGVAPRMLLGASGTALALACLPLIPRLAAAAVPMDGIVIDISTGVLACVSVGIAGYLLSLQWQQVRSLVKSG
jgi:O-antigen/teichoic acid export membrane protein